MGAHRYERDVKRRTVVFVASVVALIGTFAGLPAVSEAASAPSIESESVSNITPTDATIEAQINTGGRETTYRVWVGNYPECIEEMMEECESSAKHPIDGILAGSSSPTRISVDVAQAWHALSPGSSYIYHVDATNSDWGAFDGSAYGENKTFTTPAAKAPSIEGESVSDITPIDATLEAQINTEGLEASYEFQLFHHLCPPGTEPLGCKAMIEKVPLPMGQLLGSFVGQSVSLDLNSASVTLGPDAEYDYRVIASSAAGSKDGTLQTFITPEDGVQPLNTTTSPGPQPTAGAPQNAGQSTVAPGAIGPANTVTPPPKTRTLTNAQKLARALRACKRKPRKRRARCVRQAHTRYGTTAKARKR